MYNAFCTAAPILPCKTYYAVDSMDPKKNKLVSTSIKGNSVDMKMNKRTGKRALKEQEEGVETKQGISDIVTRRWHLHLEDDNAPRRILSSRETWLLAK